VIVHAATPAVDTRPKELVELADGEQPGVTRKLTCRGLDDQRVAEEV
jgi:hypothetical protein